MIYDVSVPVTNDLPVWPSDPPVKLTAQCHLSDDKSHTIRITAIEMGSHTGTHIDAPWHFVEGGRKLHQIPLDNLIGKTDVVAIHGVRSIQRSHLEGMNWSEVERVLFKTDNSVHWNDGHFFADFVYLEPDAAAFLVSRNIRLVGIDYLSIDPLGSTSHPAHFALLPHNVVVLEGLNLNGIAPGRYYMVALPLNLQGDGAPARVVLIDDLEKRNP